MKYVFLNPRLFYVLKPKKIIEELKKIFLLLKKEFIAYINFLNVYTRGKIFYFSHNFEKNKSIIVRSVLIKRGKRNRFFLHISVMTILALGVIVSPFISDPFSQNEEQVLSALAFSEEVQSLAPEEVFETEESIKPRSEIVKYTVQKGDTLSGIADKFGVSEDTIRWENNIKGDSISVGDEILVLPVSGIAHKVARGDTIYTIAKKYDANAQAIVDFPFNDFADPQTFSLVIGQIVIVPDGVEPKAQPTYIRRQPFIATGPVTITGAGFTWPVRGTLNQYYAWYHGGIDIGASSGVPVVAAQDGVVSQVFNGGWNGGYGIHVIISGDNGYTTLYAHMSGTNVTPGQRVAAGGSVIGWVGSTGRSTGPHLHFEVRGAGGTLNPLSFLQ